MGPNLYHARHGAVLEVAVDAVHAPAVAQRWIAATRTLLDAMGWEREVIVTRSWPGGLGLFATAPIDALLAATEVTEQALALVDADHTAPLDDVVARLRVHVQHERNPRLAALVAAAEARGLGFTFDDDVVGLGGGTGSQQWPLRRVPDSLGVAWDTLHDIPTALVTGSNGKTTTTRLVAAMSRRAGLVTGHTCTDGVWIDDVQVEDGDWSGPAGARRVVQDRQVQVAVLETARGGILRRGLGVNVADVAVVTRVTPDHFGEYGIHDEWSLGEAKLVVRRALRRGAPVVLNADDLQLVALSRTIDAPVWWFSLEPENPVLRQAALAGSGVATVREGQLELSAAGVILCTLPLADVPSVLDGVARHNVANVLAAILVAHALGIDARAMVDTLRTFGLSPLDNPGRLQVRQVRGATVIVDFVHNPDGWTVMLELARHLQSPTGRLIVTLGQAGDRDDADLDEMARVVWAARPHLIVLKEMESYLRGRPYGQVTARLDLALREAGAPSDILQLAPDEPEASRRALEAARPGDVVLIASHANYAEVIDMVDRAAREVVA
jgi:UDP-N-acetylmuramyl tripeptide synthase